MCVCVCGGVGDMYCMRCMRVCVCYTGVLWVVVAWVCYIGLKCVYGVGDVHLCVWCV